MPDERRWVTVLFVDIAGFTAISERLDPEEVMEFAARAAERISEVVRRFGGSMLRVIGDEVFAVFGAPVAYEDDAERAVRATLAMLDLKISDSHNNEVQVQEAIGELSQAVTVARRLGDPAIFLRAGSELLRLDEDEAIAQETLSASQKILAALPDGEMRLRFQESEGMRLLLKLTG